jgi:hypothetical protein
MDSMPTANVRAVGAVFVGKPKNQFYGDRSYSAMDPHGHVCTFGQTVRRVIREDAEKASGPKIEGWMWPIRSTQSSGRDPREGRPTICFANEVSLLQSVLRNAFYAEKFSH